MIATAMAVITAVGHDGGGHACVVVGHGCVVVGHFCEGVGYICDGLLAVVRKWSMLLHYEDCTSFNYVNICTYTPVDTPMEALLYILLWKICIKLTATLLQLVIVTSATYTVGYACNSELLLYHSFQLSSLPPL